MPANGSADRRTALDALSSLSGKWDPVVILTLRDEGALGFNALLEEIPDISGKVLSDTLETLEDRGLVERRVLSESPLRVEYDLTAPGRDLDPVFEALTEWGTLHLESTRPTVLVADADRRLTELYGRWLRERYDVERTHGVTALAARDLTSVDVAFVADNLPGAALESLFENVRAHCRTVLLVGGRPGTDLLDVPCDDVVRKPVVRSTVLDIVDEQLSRRDESVDRRERSALEAKRAVLEATHPTESLESEEAYLEACSHLGMPADEYGA